MSESEAKRMVATLDQLPIEDFLCMFILITTMAGGREKAATIKRKLPELQKQYTEILKAGPEENRETYRW